MAEQTTAPQRPGRWHGSAAMVAAVVLVAGFVVSLAGVGILTVQQRRVTEQMMDRRTEAAQGDITAEARRYTDAVQAVAAGLSAQRDLARENFLEITAPLAGRPLGGAAGVSFIVPATAGQIDQTQTFWRAHGAEGLVLQPVGTGDEHTFLIFQRPLDGTTATTLGRDGSQAAEPAQALAEARRAGKVTVSNPYQLFRDSSLPAAQRQLSYVLAAPVYGPADATLRRPFRGWAVMGLRGKDFITTALQQSSKGQLDATLVGAGSNGQPVTVATLATGRHTDLHRDVPIIVGQQRWTLRLAARSDTLNSTATTLVRVALVTGGLLSALLAALVFILLSSRARGIIHTDAATAGLRRAEQRARDQADLLTAVMTSISEGVIVVDGDGDLLHYNPAAAPIVEVDGVKPDRRTWLDAFPCYRPDGITPFPPDELPLTRVLRHGEAVERVELTVGNAGPLAGAILSVSAHPLDDGAGKTGAVAVFRDITGSVKHAADLVAQQDELKAFAGTVAHDLRAPLTGVGGFAEIVQDELLDNPSQVTPRTLHGLDRIMKGVDRMSRLIDDLLGSATGRQGAFAPQAVDLNTVVADVIAERTAHLRTPTSTDGTPPTAFPDIYAGELPTVYADPAMTRQLVDNLIGNALKFTMPGQPAHIDIAAHRQTDGNVCIEVADRGIGIPSEQHGTIFGTFHRAHAEGSYEGIGLGLAICQRIVESHGGAICVTDNPGGGSCFRFTLPTAPWSGHAPELRIGSKLMVDAYATRGGSPDSPFAANRSWPADNG